MKIFRVSMIACLCVLYLLQPEVGKADVRQENFKYKNGLLSINVRSASLKNVLDVVSRKVGVDIYVFDADVSDITVDFAEKSLHDGLRAILKDFNYAIVYPQGESKTGVHWLKKFSMENSGGSNLNKKEDSFSDFTSEHVITANENNEGITDHNITEQNVTEDDAVNKSSYPEAEGQSSSNHKGMSKEAAKIKRRIEILEQQIKSGYADNQYNEWAAIKGEEFVRRPSEQLEEYKQQLARLTGN